MEASGEEDCSSSIINRILQWSLTDDYALLQIVAEHGSSRTAWDAAAEALNVVPAVATVRWCALTTKELKHALLRAPWSQAELAVLTRAYLQSKPLRSNGQLPALAFYKAMSNFLPGRSPSAVRQVMNVKLLHDMGLGAVQASPEEAPLSGEAWQELFSLWLSSAQAQMPAAEAKQLAQGLLATTCATMPQSGRPAGSAAVGTGHTDADDSRSGSSLRDADRAAGAAMTTAVVEDGSVHPMAGAANGPSAQPGPDVRPAAGPDAKGPCRTRKRKTTNSHSIAALLGTPKTYWFTSMVSRDGVDAVTAECSSQQPISAAAAAAAGPPTGLPMRQLSVQSPGVQEQNGSSAWCAAAAAGAPDISATQCPPDPWQDAWSTAYPDESWLDAQLQDGMRPLRSSLCSPCTPSNNAQPAPAFVTPGVQNHTGGLAGSMSGPGAPGNVLQDCTPLPPSYQQTVGSNLPAAGLLSQGDAPVGSVQGPQDPARQQQQAVPPAQTLVQDPSVDWEWEAMLEDLSGLTATMSDGTATDSAPQAAPNSCAGSLPNGWSSPEVAAPCLAGALSAPHQGVFSTGLPHAAGQWLQRETPATLPHAAMWTGPTDQQHLHLPLQQAVQQQSPTNGGVVGSLPQLSLSTAAVNGDGSAANANPGGHLSVADVTPGLLLQPQQQQQVVAQQQYWQQQQQQQAQSSLWQLGSSSCCPLPAVATPCVPALPQQLPDSSSAQDAKLAALEASLSALQDMVTGVHKMAQHLSGDPREQPANMTKAFISTQLDMLQRQQQQLQLKLQQLQEEVIGNMHPALQQQQAPCMLPAGTPLRCTGLQ